MLRIIATITGVFIFFVGGAVAGPTIWVNPGMVHEDYLVPPGGSFIETITVRNYGDAPLSISQIGFVEASFGPRNWLTVSETELYVLPGTENGVEFDVIVDGTDYDVSCNLLGEVFLLSNAENEDSLSIRVNVDLWDVNPAVYWAIMQTDMWMYTVVDPDRECVGLAVSSHGVMGIPGWRAMHLDYFESGFECGSRDADHVYLVSGSPYVLIDDGASVSLTTSTYQSGQVMDYYWQPAPGSPGMYWGFRGGYGSYEYVGTSELVNRDGRIGMERTYYAPYTPPGHSNYIIVETKIYSADGQPHSHVTIGSVVDWDIPSDQVAMNTSGVSYWSRPSGSREFTYVQGTDTAGSAACQSSSSRYGAEVFIGGLQWTPRWTNDISGLFWGTMVGSQALLLGTSKAGDGSPIAPPEPGGRAWLDSIAGSPGYNGDPTAFNQAIWMTWLYDFDLASEDTLSFLTTLTTVRDGTLNNLAYQAQQSRLFHEMAIWGYCCGCCAGRVGDANGLGGDEPTIGDISLMIDALFITGSLNIIDCLDEVDVSQNGGCCSDSKHFTIVDISILIDYLFITGPSLGLPPCVW